MRYGMGLPQTLEPHMAGSVANGVENVRPLVQSRMRNGSIKLRVWVQTSTGLTFYSRYSTKPILDDPRSGSQASAA